MYMQRQRGQVLRFNKCRVKRFKRKTNSMIRSYGSFKREESWSAWKGIVSSHNRIPHYRKIIYDNCVPTAQAYSKDIAISILPLRNVLGGYCPNNDKCKKIGNPNGPVGYFFPPRKKIFHKTKDFISTTANASMLLKSKHCFTTYSLYPFHCHSLFMGNWRQILFERPSLRQECNNASCFDTIVQGHIQTIHGMNISWPTCTGSSLEASKVRKKCKFSSSKKPFSNQILEMQPNLDQMSVS